MPLATIPVRCNPYPIGEQVLSDSDGDDGILADAEETVLLIAVTTSGSGYLSEYERQT